MTGFMIHLFEQMSLKEAKQIKKERYDEIHNIESQFPISKLIFGDNYFKTDQLIARSKILEKGRKDQSSGGELMRVR